MNPAPTRPDDAERTTGPIDGVDLKLTVAQVLDRWPCAGLAVAVIRDGQLAWLNGHGLDGRGAPVPLATMVLRLLLGLSVDPIRIDIAPRPETGAKSAGGTARPPVR